MELRNKTIVITGGTKGLGYAMAKMLKVEGANVVVCSHNPEHVKTAGEELGVIAFIADVTKESDLEDLAKQVVDKFGQIDIWVNNAGIFLPESLAENFDMGGVKNIFDVNVFGTMNGSKVAIREFKMKDMDGLVINMASTAALEGKPMISAYSSSKWAVRGFTEAIRKENLNSKIKIFTIFFGGTKTHLYDEKKPDNFDVFMEPDYVTEKIISNLKQEVPEEELVIKRPTV